jgi:1,4-alpha-glucan branching enzyme
LPLSHDEVVYGKKSIIGRMSGDEWQRFANLRLLYGYMFTHPGTKLLFMGAEFGQIIEWNFEGSLDWHLLEYDFHKGIKNFITDLNTVYKKHPALYEKQFEADGFEWINYNDNENAVLSYIRKGKNENDTLIVICNFTPVVREDYRIGLPKKGKLIELFNSDATIYGGSGLNNSNPISIVSIPWNGRDFSAAINLPPLGISIFKITD